MTPLASVVLLIMFFNCHPIPHTYPHNGMMFLGYKGKSDDAFSHSTGSPLTSHQFHLANADWLLVSGIILDAESVTPVAPN